jgi:flagellar biogenesis protein FliO
MSDLEWIRQTAGVAVAMLLLAGAAWWLKRSGPMARGIARGRGRRRLEAVERLPLGPQHTLWLVRVGARGMLVGLSHAGCTVLESGEWERFGSPEAGS